MIYAAQFVMLLMRANPLRGQVGGGWALEIETFLGLVDGIELLGECHLGPKKVEICPHQKHYVQGCINQRSIGSFMYMSFQSL
jgi:hypothetical protein